MSDNDDADVTEIDTAVIGLGSAGEHVASTLTDAGRRVVGFEPGLVGGECPFLACIPSKVLLHHASIGSDWSTALAHRDEATNQRDDTGHAEGLEQAGVGIVRHPARLVDDRIVEADGRRWRAGHVVLATGARASIPDLGVDREVIWTSEDYLTARELPRSLVIVGGGAIGCELATVHAGFGHEVTLVDRELLLAGDVDDDVAHHLADRLRSLGVDVHTNADIDLVARDDSSTRVTMTLTDDTRLSADRLLVAAGTTPRWDDLGLESVGIDPSDGPPEVDADLRVGGRDWLRAVGDLDGSAPWTHGANHQASWLADDLLGWRWPTDRSSPLAHCVFTNPPVAAIGPTAKRARDQGLDVVRGRATYDDIARPATDRLGDGIVTVVAERRSGRLVGASGIGARFDEVISTMAAWMQMGASIDDALRTVLPFPTVAQVLTPALEDAARQR